MVREFDFYVVPTPIGNIKDISLRAIDILKEVDVIACEDTRITQKLLNHYDIKTPCISYHKYNERERVDYFLSELRIGKRIALVSDAGTPLICDPGSVIIDALIQNGFAVTSLPGACAITTFLSQLPKIGEDFEFIGFIPRTESQIREVLNRKKYSNIVFYDSPERILKTLKIIQSVRGDVKIALGRELSKLFEEIKIGAVSDILEYFKAGIKGEIICMVYAELFSDDSEIDYQIKVLKSKGFRDKEISVILSALFDYNKNKVYKKSLEL